MILSLLFNGCSKDDEDEDKQEVASITKDNGIKVMTVYMTSLSHAMTSIMSLGLSIPIQRPSIEHALPQILEAFPPENLRKPVLDTTIVMQNDSQYMSITVKETNKLYLTLIYKATRDTLNLTADIALYDASNQIIPVADTSSREIKKVVFNYDMVSSTFEPLYGRVKQDGDGNYTITFTQEDVYQIDGTGNQATTLENEYYELKTTCHQVVIDNSDEDAEELYPKSGYIKLESPDGSYLKLTFNGTQYASIEIYDGSKTYTYTMNMETGEIPTL